jgi:hypothetical protein
MGKFRQILDRNKIQKPLDYSNHGLYTRPEHWPHPVSYLLEPRPDLIEDSELWSKQILHNAWQLDETPTREYHGLLHCLRCLGARARMTWYTENGLKKPWIELSRGEIPEAEWDEIKREWLGPRREGLEAILDPSSGRS